MDVRAAIKALGKGGTQSGNVRIISLPENASAPALAEELKRLLEGMKHPVEINGPGGEKKKEEVPAPKPAPARGDSKDKSVYAPNDNDVQYVSQQLYDPQQKPAAFAAVARALKPGGSFVIFDETYPATDAELRTMPSRFAALAQWFELTWGNRLNTKPELAALCASAGLVLADETSFSRFYVGVAEKR